MKGLALFVAAFLVAVACVPSRAGAQTLQVSPIMVEFLPGQRATTLAVTNKGATKTALQLRPFAWSQSLEKDVLQPTADLAASPPIAEIGPGETQTFRLVLRTEPKAQEASYRLLLDQLPEAESAGTVRVALRISVPVFAKPGTRADRKLVWEVVISPAGARLVASNQGSEHVRVVDPVLTQSGARRFMLSGSRNPYLLPGMTRSWSIASGSGLQPGSSLHLTAMSNEGTIDAVVPVSRP